MKDYPYVPGWRLNKENNKPAIKHSVLMLTTHGVAEGEWDGNEWVQYRWSCKVKDSDVLYWIHLEDLIQLEKEGDSLQQEQPEVELNREIGRWMDKLDDRYCALVEDYSIQDIKDTARHFYELGLNAKDNAPKIKGWVARDKSGDLYFFHYDCKPHRTDGIFHSECSEDVFHLDNSMFSGVDWLTEPIKVELTISRVSK